MKLSFMIGIGTTTVHVNITGILLKIISRVNSYFLETMVYISHVLLVFHTLEFLGFRTTLKVVRKGKSYAIEREATSRCII